MKDITAAGGERDPQTINSESPDHGSSEDMEDESEDMGGGNSNPDEEDSGDSRHNDGYVSMKGAEAEFMITRNEAYASNTTEVNLNIEIFNEELAIETVQNEAYTSTLAAAKMAEASCEEYFVTNEASLTEKVTNYKNIVVKLEDEVTSARELPPYENVYSTKTTTARKGTYSMQTLRSTGEKG